MPSRTHRVVTTALISVVTAASLLTGSTAFAHDQLISSAPSAGEALIDPPDQIVLTMSAGALEIGTEVLVTDLNGTDFATGLTLNGPLVTVDLTEIPDGFYDVRWRVVSSDGHPISGIIPFSVGSVGERPTAAPTAMSAATPTKESPSAAAGDTAEQERDTSPLRSLAIAAGGAVVALGLLWLIGRVRNHRIRTLSDQENSQ